MYLFKGLNIRDPPIIIPIKGGFIDKGSKFSPYAGKVPSVQLMAGLLFGLGLRVQGPK